MHDASPAGTGFALTYLDVRPYDWHLQSCRHPFDQRSNPMLVKDIMTHNVDVVAPSDTLEQAARKMSELNVGPLPVCEGNRVVGILTDRDITVRATAAGCDPKATLVYEAMSQELVNCFEDQDVSEAATLMKERQLRRLLVFNRSNDLVGIVSLGDLVTETGDKGQSGDVLDKVSQPGRG